MDFFYAPHTCALASHIALHDAGADFTPHRVDFRSQQQRSADYLKINPKGRVPSLIVNGVVLTETPAILSYIAQRYPEADLAPLDDPMAFALMQSVMSYLCSTLHVAHAHGMRGARWADEPEAIEAMKRKVPESVTNAWQIVEDMLVGPFVLGERYSVADPYLFTVARWMESDQVDLANFPRVVAHRERIGERPSAQEALKTELGTV